MLIPGVAVAGPTYDSQSPLSDITEQVTDKSNVVSDTDGLNAYAKASSSDVVDVYVVFVDDFSGTDPIAWCVHSANDSHLPDNAYMLAVATQQREYATCYGPAVDPVLAIDGVDKMFVPALSSSDWDGAAKAFAGAVRAAEKAGDITAVTDYPADEGFTNPDSDDDTPLAWLIAFIVIVVMTLVVFMKQKHEKRDREKRQMQALLKNPSGYMDNSKNEQDIFVDYTSKNYQKQIEKVVQQASKLSLEADNDVRTAREDLEFARLEYSIDDVKQMEVSIAQAAQASQEAFAKVSELNEITDPATRERTARAAIDAARSAKKLIRDHRASFDTTRDLHANVAQYLSQGRTKLQELRAQIPQMKTELKNLKVTYPDTDLGSIDSNDERAEALLDSAEATLESGEKYQQRANSQLAVANLQLARRTLTQAQTLIDAVMDASKNLQQIRTLLLQGMTSLSADISDVDALVKDNGKFDALVNEARAAIDNAEKAGNGTGDPLDALQRLTEAEAVLDEALEPYRDSKASTDKLWQRVNQQYSVASAKVSEADTYISTRRGGVKTKARQLVNQARSQLASYDKEDPTKALQQLSQAQNLAEAALSRAQSDIDTTVSTYDYYSPRNRRRGNIDIGSMVLGGILFGNDNDTDLFGPSRSSRSSSSGWSGGSSGSFGGFGGGGGFSGGSSGKF